MSHDQPAMLERCHGKSGKAAFIKCGSFSHINARVEEQLRAKFPELEIDTIDIRRLAFKNKRAALRNLWAMLWEYGPIRLIKKRDPIDYFIQSSATFHYLSQEFRKLAAGERYRFTFQTQSMWDASTHGVPHFIYTDHTELANATYPGYDRRRLLGPWWSALETRIYRNAARIFTMSSHVTQSLVEDYGCSSEFIECVYAGSNSMPAEVPVIRDFTKKPVILFVGVDWRRKGGPDLVNAFVRLRSRLPEAVLRIVGCSPNLKVANCKILGRVPLSDMPRLYEEASVFCLPTRAEPFGIAFVEAMHAGLPVVGSDIGAVRDMVIDGQNGYRVAVGDVQGLEEALEKLLGSPVTMKSMGDASRRIARNRYTWDLVGAKIAAAIRQHI